MTGTYKQAGELLDADRTAKGRVRVLLDYMTRHEQNYEAALAEYDEESARRLLKTWMQFTPDPAALAVPEVKHIDRAMAVDDVVAIAMDVDDQLVRFYSDAAHLSKVDELRQLFETLKQKEEARKASFSQVATDIKQQM